MPPSTFDVNWLQIQPQHANLRSISQALIDLLWLSVCYRIQYKLALMMYMAHTGQTTSYIKDAVTPVSLDLTRRHLHSADTTDYAGSRAWTKFGERAFCVAGPSTWNSLPESLRRTDCTETFKRRPKTHFFNVYLGSYVFNFSLFYTYIFIHHTMIERTEQKVQQKSTQKNNNNGTSYGNLHITL